MGTGRDIRPVFGGQKHYMFCPRQAVFSVTRNRFRNRKQLARKGVENSSEVVVFYRAPHVPRPDFNRRRVSGALRSKMGPLEGIIASYGQKKRSRLSKAAPTNGDIMFRFSDENHTGFLTVITRYDEHSEACSISNLLRDRPSLHTHKQRKTKKLATTMVFSRAQFHRNSVNYYHDLRRLRTILLCKKYAGKPAYGHTQI